MDKTFTTSDFAKWFDENYHRYLDYELELRRDDGVLLFGGELFEIPYKMATLKNVTYEIYIYDYNKTIYIKIILHDTKNK